MQEIYDNMKDGVVEKKLDVFSPGISVGFKYMFCLILLNDLYIHEGKY